MKVTIFNANVYCSDECLIAALEEGENIVKLPEVQRATIGHYKSPLLEALLERATCDCCGMNLRDIERETATPNTGD